MNEDQLRLAIEKFSILQSGMSNKEIKAIGLRPFCQRIQRRIKGTKRVLSLYVLTPEWVKYIKENNHTEDKLEEKETMMKTHRKGDRVLYELENSIMNTELKDNEKTIIDRILLIYEHYEKLITEGVSFVEIIKTDLYGMLRKYLIPTEEIKLKIKLEYQLPILYIIHKYCDEDISEFEDIIKSNFETETTQLKYLKQHTSRKINDLESQHVEYKDESDFSVFYNSR